MKLTNSEITTALMVINKLGQKEMPIKTSYEMLKVGKALEAQAQIIEEIRKKLIDKYGEEGQVKAGTEAMNKFFEEFNPILREEIKMNIKKFKLPDDITISLQDLAGLEKLLDN